MFPEYKIIQIVEVPKNGDNKYAIRILGRMEYFDFDFMCKNTLKKFFMDGGFDSGEYIIIRDNESSGDTYLVEAICVYREKEQGNFLDFKLPGEEWKDFVINTLENAPGINVKFDIQTVHKLSIPKICTEESE